MNEMIQAIRAEFGDQVKAATLLEVAERDGFENAYQMVRSLCPRISRGVYDLTKVVAVGSSFTPPVVNKPTKNELDAAISNRFRVFDQITEGVVSGNINSVIVAGAPGVGKTYTLEKKLDAAAKANRIKSVQHYSGSVSALGLYQALYENSGNGQVLVLDDIDSVFNDEEALNLLKGALDTSETRSISWLKNSRYLDGLDIPRTFDFNGRVVFITNLNFDSQIDRETRLSPHLKALMSRSVYLDLGIHTNEEVMVRIEQVCKVPAFIKQLNMNPADLNDLLEWMNENVAKMRTVSIRTMIQAAGFAKTTSDWKSLAEVTLLRVR